LGKRRSPLRQSTWRATVTVCCSIRGRHGRQVVLGLASGQINMCKVDGWNTLATKPTDQQFDLVAA
jgi:hypothetical protein